MSKYNFPPGPPQNLVFGNLFNVDTTEIHKTLFDHKDKYGDISYFYVAGKHWVSLNSIDAVLKTYQTKETRNLVLGKGDLFTSREFFTNGVLNPFPDKKQKEIRCIWKTALEKVEYFQGNQEFLVNEEIQNFIEKLTQTQNLINPSDAIAKSIINCNLIALTGHRFDYGDEIFLLYESLHSYLSEIYMPVHLGLLTKFPILASLPFWIGKSVKNAKRTINKIKTIIIDNIPYSDKDFSSVISDFYKAKKTNDEINADNLASIAIESEVGLNYPTRMSFMCLIHQLLCNQEVQLKIQDEIDAIIGHERQPRIEDLSLMPFTHAVLWESFRLSASFPTGSPGRNTEDIKIYDYFLPKNSIFILNIWRIHHDEELWEDPWSFKPSRYMTEKGQIVSTDHPNCKNMIVFGASRRQCLGKKRVFNTFFLYLTNILQKFTIGNGGSRVDDSCDPRGYLYKTVMQPPPFEIVLLRRPAPSI